MAGGELVFANVVDSRVYASQGADGPAGIYTVAIPGRALPFVTDPRTIDRLAQAGEVRFEEIYALVV